MSKQHEHPHPFKENGINLCTRCGNADNDICTKTDQSIVQIIGVFQHKLNFVCKKNLIRETPPKRNSVQKLL